MHPREAAGPDAEVPREMPAGLMAGGCGQPMMVLELHCPCNSRH